LHPRICVDMFGPDQSFNYPRRSICIRGPILLSLIAQKVTCQSAWISYILFCFAGSKSYENSAKGMNLHRISRTNPESRILSILV
jgi:hypothetical protein